MEQNFLSFSSLFWVSLSHSRSIDRLISRASDRNNNDNSFLMEADTPASRINFLHILGIASRRKNTLIFKEKSVSYSDASFNCHGTKRRTWQGVLFSCVVLIWLIRSTKNKQRDSSSCCCNNLLLRLCIKLIHLNPEMFISAPFFCNVH